jgi:hypothetical protein
VFDSDGKSGILAIFPKTTPVPKMPKKGPNNPTGPGPVGQKETAKTIYESGTAATLSGHHTLE